MSIEKMSLGELEVFLTSLHQVRVIAHKNEIEARDRKEQYIDQIRQVQRRMAELVRQG